MASDLEASSSDSEGDGSGGAAVAPATAAERRGQTAQAPASDAAATAGGSDSGTPATASLQAAVSGTGAQTLPPARITASCAPADIFDAVVGLEDRLLDEGWEAGRAKGRELGFLEGRDLGLTKGAEIGEEVGFYAGCVQSLRLAGAVQPGLLSERMSRAVDALAALLREFPVADPLDEGLLDDLQRIRAKFKVISAVTKVPLAFDPAKVEASRTMAF